MRGDERPAWICPSCHDPRGRWVGASLTGPVSLGGKPLRQCVPCGRFTDDKDNQHTDPAPSPSIPPEPVTPEPEGCTGLTASWCPIHGDCTCIRSHEDPRFQADESADTYDGADIHLNADDCPLHASSSEHPAAPSPDRLRERVEGDVVQVPRAAWDAFIAAHDAACSVTTPSADAWGSVEPGAASRARSDLLHAAHQLARAAAASGSGEGQR